MTEVISTDQTVKQIWDALQEVKDPEIPFISVVDLGIITKVEVNGQGHATVNMTPTFSGCPALDLMHQQIKEAVAACNVNSYEVNIDLGITWNSNRITEKGKQQLENFGLGRPETMLGEFNAEMVAYAKCPYCGSDDTTLSSPFGSALCRSIHYCNNCHTGFERFKPVE